MCVCVCVCVCVSVRACVRASMVHEYEGKLALHVFYLVIMNAVQINVVNYAYGYMHDYPIAIHYMLRKLHCMELKSQLAI